MANRTVIVDNNTWNNTHIATVGRAMASPEKKAWQIYRELDVEYVLVVFGAFIGCARACARVCVRMGGALAPAPALAGPARAHTCCIVHVQLDTKHAPGRLQNPTSQLQRPRDLVEHHACKLLIISCRPRPLLPQRRVRTAAASTATPHAPAATAPHPASAACTLTARSTAE